MNYKEKIMFLVFVILVAFIWITFGERIMKGSGWDVAVVSGTGVERQVRNYGNVRSCLEYQDYLEAVAALKEGTVDAVIMDRLDALNSLKRFGGNDLKLVGERLTDRKGRAVFRPGDDMLCLQFNKALLELIRDKTYEQLSVKYFGVNLLDNKNIKKPLLMDVSIRDIRGADESWAEIQKKGVLEFGIMVNNPPFCYYGQDKRLTGFEVELTEAIAKKLGIKYKLVVMERREAYDALIKGRCDAFLYGTNSINSLGGKVAYSEPYYFSGAQLVVLAESPINGPETLNQRIPSFKSLLRRRMIKW